MTALAPLQCASCGAAVPLVDAAQHPCPFCQHTISTPPDYLQAVSLRREAVAARKAAEPQWQRLAAGSSPWWKILGATALTFAPPVLTAIGLAAEPAHATASVFALFTLPALLPGGILYVWGATSDASHRGMQSALAARPPKSEGAPPTCRVCGAPLAVGEGDISCTCLYCGTDSLVSAMPTAIHSEHGKALSSLADATRAVRLRSWLVRLALLGIAAVIIGFSFALYWAQTQLS